MKIKIKKLLMTALSVSVLLLLGAISVFAMDSSAFKAELANAYDPAEGKLPSEDGWNINSVSNGCAVVENEVLKITANTKGKKARWYINGEKHAYDAQKGMTAEVVLKMNETAGRGFDFEVYNGKGQRYLISLKIDGGQDVISYLTAYSGSFTTVAAFDRDDQFHTYRLIIYPDNQFALCRDGQILMCKAVPNSETVATDNGGNPYFMWGKGSSGATFTGAVKKVSWDYSGVYLPVLPEGVKSSNAFLSDIRIDGKTIEGFSGATYAYSIDLSTPAQIPSVDYTVMDERATVTTQSGSLMNPYIITVTAEDGQTIMEYFIKFNIKHAVETIDIPVGAQTLTMAKIHAGSFVMGSASGEVYVDETPAHVVNISNDFYLAETEITNALFELHYPEHNAVRGKLGYNNMFNDSIGDTVNGTTIFGFSKEDDEAAVFISWNEAVAFCEWLNENYLPSEMKNAGYEFRLPTEAEWEYACRAGTASDYNTGDALPKEYQNNNTQNLLFYPDVVGKKDFNAPGALTVKAHGAPNAWGLYDMHGNVEEWVYDWYGPYSEAEQTDPVGPSDGSSKITRGGSHSTLVKYLRSANRSSAVSEDRNWMIGFRVALGKPIDTLAAPSAAVDGTLNYQQNVSQESPTFIHDYDAEDAAPYFNGPNSDADHYVKITGANNITGPFFTHMHQPAITECPNGDLLAIWYTGAGENSRELNYAVSRKTFNPDNGTYSDWSPAEVFFDCADRNNHGAALFTDYKNGKVVFICGQSHSSAYGGLILLMRESYDNGASWSSARVIAPEYQIRQQAIGSAYVDDRGYYILTCDASSSGSGGSAFWISKDSGKTWTDTGAVASFKAAYDNDISNYKSIDNYRSIAGIHAASVQVVDESGNPYYIAIGRGDSINGNLPLSISTDDGATWTKVDTGLQKIDSLKRGVLKRLESGNILLVSFTQSGKSITLKDSAGDDVVYTGMYAALSEDNGKTWPYIRFLTDDKNESKTMDGLGNTGTFTMTRTAAEPKGYLTGVQTRDGLVHILSSAFEYTFNEAWVKQTPPSYKAMGVLLNETALQLTVGEMKQLVATVIPEHAENKEVVWESDNEAVAAVDGNGTVDAVAPGTANIKVITADGAYFAVCKVVVIAKKGSGDVNGDEKVDLLDVMTLLHAILNDQTVPESDLNGDGKASLWDVLQVLKLAVQ